MSSLPVASNPTVTEKQPLPRNCEVRICHRRDNGLVGVSSECPNRRQSKSHRPLIFNPQFPNSCETVLPTFTIVDTTARLLQRFVAT